MKKSRTREPDDTMPMSLVAIQQRFADMRVGPDELTPDDLDRIIAEVRADRPGEPNENAAYRYDQHLRLGYARWQRSREAWDKSGKAGAWIETRSGAAAPRGAPGRPPTAAQPSFSSARQKGRILQESWFCDKQPPDEG